VSRELLSERALNLSLKLREETPNRPNHSEREIEYLRVQKKISQNETALKHHFEQEGI